jgi:2-oxoglutarate dehydrogenase E2 component (dihydrolipoamide succinyltransferase)
MATQVIMPQLGESVVEGTVMQWFKKEGEKIDEFESLLEVNTDKVNSEIPAPAGGVVLKILVPEGETVKAGTIIAWIGQPGESIEGVPAPAPQGHAQAAPVPVQPAEAAQVSVPPVGRDRDLGFISPVVAKIAREHNVDLYAVKGSGEGGRITKKDVLAYLEGAHQSTAAPAQPEPAAWETPGEGDLFRPTELMFANNLPPAAPAVSKPAAPQPPPAPGGGRLVALSQMRKRIAEHMVFSKTTSPHVTSVMEADLSRVVAHREANKALFERDGVKLTFTAYFMAAAAAALRTYPFVNSSWRDEGVWLHDQINIGMATSLGEEGLIVPVIKGAERLSLLNMARTVNDLASRGRDHKLLPDEVQGGTFTITNHGTGGSLFATPIINQPQCAILGVGAVQKRVVVLENDAIAVRPMVYLSLTFDHRILDGDYADKFLMHIVTFLEKWEWS